MWQCRHCGSNNERASCWRCGASRPGAPSATRRRLSIWVVVGCAAGIAALGLLGTVGVGRAISHLTTPARALNAPASISGLPRVGDASAPTTASVAGQSLVSIASGVYGSGDVRYVLVAVSAGSVLGGRAAIVDAIAPQVVGDQALDPATKTTTNRAGATFTCWRTTGPVGGAVCSWNADGITGVVTQIGSADLSRAADFAIAARGALSAG